jgi:hypothetical protein
MATNEIDRSQIDQMISAIRDRRIPRAAPVSEHVQMRNLRQSVVEELKPIFDRAGLDVEEINRVLTRHQQDARQLVEERKSQTATKLAGRAEERRAQLAYRSRVLNRIANTPLVCVTIPVQEAYAISAVPTNMLTGSGIKPYNWAKIYWASSEDTDKHYPDVELDFYFFWTNPNDFPVFVSATTDLSALGVLAGVANSGWLGGVGEIYLGGSIQAYVGDQHFFPGWWWFGAEIGEVRAASGGLWGLFGTSSDHATTTLEGQPISFSQVFSPIEVPPNQVIVFEVSAGASLLIENGSVSLDFSSDDFSIVCPGVNLEVCYPGNVIQLQA